MGWETLYKSYNTAQLLRNCHSGAFVARTASRSQCQGRPTRATSARGRRLTFPSTAATTRTSGTTARKARRGRERAPLGRVRVRTRVRQCNRGWHFFPFKRYWVFHCLPDSAWANGNLAEAAWQLQLGNIQIKVNPTQVYEQKGHPVLNMDKYV